ncbi:MAG: Fur family transcriptional regulator [Nakamurella sp.]
MTTSTHEADLRGVALRVTKQRLAVLAAVRRNSHSDADSIVKEVRQELGQVSTQAVYDVLHALTESGLIRCVEPAGSPARYDARVGDNHHHLVCRTCGDMVDVDCAVGAAPCIEPAARHGFSIDEAEVTYWGVCPSCRIT